jgi:L-lysine exporter family protein LysE/ArgO
VLIAAGVAGAGALLDRVPEAITAVRWAGVAFLVSYGALAPAARSDLPRR